MVLGKLPVPGRPSYLHDGRAKATALAVSGGGGCLTFFSRLPFLSSFSLSFRDGPI